MGFSGNAEVRRLSLQRYLVAPTSTFNPGDLLRDAQNRSELFGAARVSPISTPSLYNQSVRQLCQISCVLEWLQMAQRDPSDSRLGEVALKAASSGVWRAGSMYCHPSVPSTRCKLQSVHCIYALSWELIWCSCKKKCIPSFIKQ